MKEIFIREFVLNDSQKKKKKNVLNRLTEVEHYTNPCIASACLGSVWIELIVAEN